MSDLEFLRKNPKDFTSEEWIQYIELIEELGGSKALRAALDAAPDDSTISKAYDEAVADTKTFTSGDERDLRKCVVTVTRRFGQMYSITTDNPKGTGLLVGTNLAGQGSGKLAFQGEDVPTVNGVLVISNSGKLVCTFQEGKDPKAVFGGVWNGTTNFQAAGAFAFTGK